MTDHVSQPKRSTIMSAIRSKNTQPELLVRSMAHQMGLRFRLHRRDLPGSPDLVFPRWKKVIFVHGCFWHGHVGCSRSKLPKARRDYWEKKIKRNVARDFENQKRLEEIGWDVHVIWQCTLKREAPLERQALLKQTMTRIFNEETVRD